jgi:arylsulfatase A-like enzyme
MVFGFAVLFTTTEVQGQDPCEQIKTACLNAGFVAGGGASGNGLKRDCIEPILQGRTHSRKSMNPVPAVDPAIVSACNAQNPSLGNKGAVASTQTSAPPTNLPPPAEKLSSSAQHPNLVFILTDDLSNNLLQYMPHVLQMQKNGVTFANYFVTDSLCCPSRTSIFTGCYPHNTGVYRNRGDDGGYDVFMSRGNERRTFATALWSAGYRTAMMGKYLNGYQPQQHPPAAGWTLWDVAGNAYKEFNYTLNQNGQVAAHGKQPSEYLTDVLSDLAGQFIKQSRGQPFVIEVATFAPHRPYIPAPRDAGAFPGLKAPRTPTYDAPPNANTAKWLRQQPPLTAADKTYIDEGFRKRAQSVLAVDAMIGALQAAVAAIGQEKNTYFVFSSDNGYHMGEYRLMPGKMTAFDTDIQVPLIVTGPGVPAGLKLDELAENIDLYPTFLELTGVQSQASADGHSLAALLQGQKVADWRKAVLIEHRGLPHAPRHPPRHEQPDPDEPAIRSGDPPTYEALRAPSAVYVEYVDGDREYHDLIADPYELNNTFGALTAEQKSALHAALTAMQNCHGAESCWAAQHSELVGPTAPRK